ncbi:MAG: peptidyl-tRNA hydrolase Pth2 [Nanoarchaeota archaeon]|nr:peptidyl-tRNA hydrolase Pth2 [Nanoarchaeota archaeon]
MEYKQVILARTDLKMDKGKLAVQCAHASVEAVLKSPKELIKKWKDSGMKKVVLKVANKKGLFDYKQKAELNGLITAAIKDAAKTFFKKPTVTCLAIGPDEEEKIDYITSELKMY